MDRIRQNVYSRDFTDRLADACEGKPGISQNLPRKHLRQAVEVARFLADRFSAGARTIYGFLEQSGLFDDKDDHGYADPQAFRKFLERWKITSGH